MAEQLVGAAVKIQLADSAIIGEEGKKKVPIVQVATFAAAAAAVITYILAMFWERSRVVYTAGGFSFVVSSVVIFQRTRLMKLESKLAPAVYPSVGRSGLRMTALFPRLSRSPIFRAHLPLLLRNSP